MRNGIVSPGCAVVPLPIADPGVAGGFRVPRIFQYGPVSFCGIVKTPPTDDAVD